MRHVRVLLMRLRSVFLSGVADRELDAELHFHLERQIQENLANHMPPEEARLQAIRSLGGVAQIADECRDERRVTLLVDFARDIRYALRGFARDRLFACVAILTLAVGIGATTSIFTVVNGVLLQPLPYADADRIVSLGTRATDTGREIPRFTGGDLLDLHEARSFDAFSAYWGGEIGVQIGGAGEFAGVYFVEPSFFKVFSVAASEGRIFTRSDGEQAAVIGHGFAARVFGSAGRALGRKISVEDQVYEIVGVLPAGFNAPRATDVWLPVPPVPAIALNRTAFNYQVVARLAPGVSPEQAQAELAATGTRLARAFPDSNRKRTFSLVALRDRLVAPARSTLYVLLGAVLLVLLVACVNVANLLLARATARSHEVALRTALGAGRFRIVRQLVTESTVLAVLGGGLGVVLAYAGTHALLGLAPENLPRLNEVAIDWRVLGFAGLCSIAAVFAFGAVPAWQTSLVDPHDALRSTSERAGAGGRSIRLRTLLVVGEIALSFALAVSAGLLFRSFVSLTRVDLGFSSESVLVVTAHRPAKGQQEYVRVAQFFSRMNAEFGSMPGVTAVGVTMGLPTGQYGSNGSYIVEGKHAGFGLQSPHAVFSLAGPGYFAALGVPLLKGRDFDDADGYDQPFVAIINQALARETFRGEDPLGRRIQCGLDSPKWMTIVGVVGDVRQDSPAAPREPQLYMPLQQHPYYANEVQVVLRTSTPPALLVPAVRSRMQHLTPQTALRFTTLGEMVDASIGTQRFRAYLVLGFAAVALLLAMAGIYGITAYLTAQRTGEFGVRVALGAQRGELVRLVLARAARLAAVGLLLGVALSLGATRVIANLLFGLQPFDLVTYVTTLLFTAAVVFAAAIVPALHASRLDPLRALRAE